MRFSPLLFASFWLLTSGDNDVKQYNSIKDYGSVHTEAFNKLAELHGEKIPESEEEMVKQLTEIVSSFCGGDSKCEESCREKMNEHYIMHQSGESGIFELPDDFDEDVLDSLSSMFSVINTVTMKESVDDILNSLDDIEKEVEGNKKASEAHKAVALGGLSVAKESARLWHDVYNDKKHPLHGMHFPEYYGDSRTNNNGRKLQWWGWFGYGGWSGGNNGGFELPDFNITYVIQKDVVTFVTAYAEFISVDPTVIVPINSAFLSSLADSLGPAIAASSYIGNQADTFYD